MKKLSLFALCFAVVLVLNQVSFAQEAAAAADATDQACVNCAVPVGYPAPFAKKGVAVRLAERRAMRSMPIAADSAYMRGDLRPRVARRMQMGQPAVAAAPMIATAPVVITPTAVGVPPALPEVPGIGAISQNGDKKNTLRQTTGTFAPTINFLSLIRPPRSSYVGY
jgi:hypothetical protein